MPSIEGKTGSSENAYASLRLGIFACAVLLGLVGDIALRIRQVPKNK